MNTQLEIISKVAVFKGNEIRKTIYKDEWWFVVVDVIKALTDSDNPRRYLKNMLNRDEELAKGWVQIEHTLPVQTDEAWINLLYFLHGSRSTSTRTDRT